MIWQRIQQTARLMVGVGDYKNYCQHMRSQHPQAPVMSETDYFRYCQSTRYPGNYSPSKDLAINRCPC